MQHSLLAVNDVWYVSHLIGFLFSGFPGFPLTITFNVFPVTTLYPDQCSLYTEFCCSFQSIQ